MQTTLYRKYRPKNFEEIAGEADIIRTLKNSLDNDRMSHAYLFCGPRGIGKTTCARLIAKGINCMNNGISSVPCNECENCKAIDNGSFIDLIEIDAASNRGIDEIRDLKEKINYQPSKGRKKIYIIDEVHMLTKEAFNALLKTLEEPPAHVIFILATTEPDKILPTIISRCQRYDFQILSLTESKAKLREICDAEDVKIDDESLELIYDVSGGSMRDAISILERVIISCLGSEITEEKTSKIIGATSKSLLKDFYEKVQSKSMVKGVTFLDSLWEESVDIEKFFKDFARYVKDSLTEGNIEVEEGLSIIGNVYDSLNKFKYEEDKRLLGYVVLNRLLNKEKRVSEKKEPVKEIIKEKIIYKEIEAGETPHINEEVDVKIEDVKTMWNEIVEKARSKKPPYGAFLITAKPTKVDDGYLYISLGNSLFAKDQLETEYYNIPLQDIIQEMTKSKIKMKYIVSEEKDEVEEADDNTLTKVIDFFSRGEN
ncbi:DNA polymerase III subunit gamma/tau [Fusobacterium sp. MFO224]|uniref:DNA polymerase III subunit gamma/tau n=1 Tax=Fusobacterium sp. MFO224 TaxID=3378070 RepID=UPI003853442A